MRRIISLLAIGFVGAAILPVVAGSEPLGGLGTAGASGPLAEMGAGLPAEVAHLAPGDPLNVLVSLDKPASPALARHLAALGQWSWTAQHIPVGALSLPVAALGALRSLDGVEGVYPDETLHYFSDRAVTAVATADPGGGGPAPIPVPNVVPGGDFGAALPIPGLGVDGKGVTVAIVDSGIDGTHPDLAPALKGNFKMSPLGPGSLPPIPMPDTDTTSGHGTHVAGDVAGRGIASHGTYKGSAPGASLIGLGAGEGLSVESRAVLQAYDWIIANKDAEGIRVVNNSYGGSFEPFNPNEPLNKATKAATDAGIVVVFAQGNDGDEMTMNNNATAPWVLAVAAGTQKKGITDFTSGGIDADVVDGNFTATDLAGDPRSPLNLGLYHPSIVALGENVVGTRAFGVVPALGLRHDVALPAGDQLRYTIMSGTSMASPEASGIVALVLEANPALTPPDVKRVLQVTARSIPDVPFWKQGYGNADPLAAVGLARQLAGQPPAEVNRILNERQAARDAEILAGLNHPLRTTAWHKSDKTDGDSAAAARTADDGAAAHTITVDPGTAYLKVVNSGGVSLPFVPDPLHTIVVKDAAGKEVARSANKLPGSSSTTIVSLDLTKLTGLSYGQWTIEVSEGGLIPAGLIGDEEATVAATFAKVEPPQPVSSILPDLPPKKKGK
ncbi:MAG TPA: S8 family serine peptidase [Acidimicrobiia bacterium]|nr:S8 family serine peptidase [Acidimicrobiia bacterium]